MSGSEGGAGRRILTSLGVLVLVALLSLGLAAGLTLNSFLLGPDLLWPGAGLAIGWSCRRPRLTPYVLVGFALATAVLVVFPLVSGHPAGSLVSISGAALAWLQTVAIVLVLRRLTLTRLGSPADLMVMLAVVFVGSVLFGLPAWALAHTTQPLWLGSWITGTLWGVVAITPLVMTVERNPHWLVPRWVEYVASVLFTLGAMIFLFWFVTPSEPGVFGWPYLIIVGLVWVAARFGVVGLAPLLAVLGWFGLVATLHDRGAFAIGAETFDGKVVVFEVFLVVVGTASLLLALLTDQRSRALAAVSDSRLLVTQVLDAAESPIFAKSYRRPGDGDGRYILTNRSWAHAVGEPTPDENGDLRDADVFPASVTEEVRRHDAEIMGHGHAIAFHERVRDTSVEGREFLTTKFPLTDDQGHIFGVGGISTDVTELSRAQELERQQAARLSAVFEYSPTPTLRCVRDGEHRVRVLAANRASMKLLGRDVTGLSTDKLSQFVSPSELPRIIEAMQTVFDAEPGVPEAMASGLEVSVRNVSGQTLDVVWSASRVSSTPDGGVEFVVQLDDVTRRRDAERALEHQAVTDGLTGLPNRTALRGRLQEAVERLAVTGGWAAVLFFDLDEFKEVNDSQGHQAGDDLLVAIADRMRQIALPGEVVARMGGDEFVVVCEQLTNPDQAVVRASRFAVQVRQPLTQQRRLLRITTSVGVAATDDPDESVDELLRRADLAMYAAKHEGPDRVKVYDEDLDTRLRVSVAIQDTLRRHLYDKSLEVHYQPVYSLSENRTVGAEALVRLPGPDGGFIPPDQFIPQAEASGLVTELDHWVLDQALSLAARWSDSGCPRQISVNVSPIDLRRDDFADSVLSAISVHGVPAERVVIEITETALLRDREHVLAELGKLREVGVRVALDDFGTGYSSLSWLTDLTVDAVKIDKSFIAALGHDTSRTAVVRAVLAVADSLGLTVTAEGIENPEQQRLLTEWGCDLAQGYLFSRPVPATDAVWTTGCPGGS